MSGSMGNMAFGAPEKSAATEAVFSLRTVNKMLPLVGRIVEDVLACQSAMGQQQPEQERLERRKRVLSWPERQRRYQLQEEISATERRMAEAGEELNELGVILLDAKSGRVGFPTLVNNRQAYFSWALGEDSLHSWHFAEESECRPIPSAWLKEIGV